jgi:hypothetical protein
LTISGGLEGGAGDAAGGTLLTAGFTGTDTGSAAAGFAPSDITAGLVAGLAVAKKSSSSSFVTLKLTSS